MERSTNTIAKSWKKSTSARHCNCSPIRWFGNNLRLDKFPLKCKSTWNQTIGASKSVPWPTGIGAPGNEGVANAIKGAPNTIGYVELNYALTTGIPYGFVKNAAGNFIEPSLNSTDADVSNAWPQNHFLREINLGVRFHYLMPLVQTHIP